MRRGPSSRSRIGSSPMVRWSLAALAAAITYAHAEILVARLRDASITEPAVAVRWLFSAVALGATVWLGRRGGARFRGRAAVVLAIGMLVVHAGAAPVPATAAGHGELLAAMPIGLVALGLLAATALVLAESTRLVGLPRRIRPLVEPVPAGSPLLSHPPLSPRPPPSVA